MKLVIAGVLALAMAAPIAHRMTPSVVDDDIGVRAARYHDLAPRETAFAHVFAMPPDLRELVTRTPPAVSIVGRVRDSRIA